MITKTTTTLSITTPPPTTTKNLSTKYYLLVLTQQQNFNLILHPREHDDARLEYINIFFHLIYLTTEKKKQNEIKI